MNMVFNDVEPSLEDGVQMLQNHDCHDLSLPEDKARTA